MNSTPNFRHNKKNLLPVENPGSSLKQGQFQLKFLDRFLRNQFAQQENYQNITKDASEYQKMLNQFSPSTLHIPDTFQKVFISTSNYIRQKKFEVILSKAPFSNIQINNLKHNIKFQYLITIMIHIMSCFPNKTMYKSTKISLFLGTSISLKTKNDLNKINGEIVIRQNVHINKSRFHMTINSLSYMFLWETNKAAKKTVNFFP